MEERNDRTIHEWMYRVVLETCGDREYLYRYFVEHYSGLMRQIYGEGTVRSSGSYRFPGLKSDLEAEVRWWLAGRINFMGPNRLKLRCSTKGQDGASGGDVREADFELSSGERIS